MRGFERRIRRGGRVLTRWVGLGGIKEKFYIVHTGGFGPSSTCVLDRLVDRPVAVYANMGKNVDAQGSSNYHRLSNTQTQHHRLFSSNQHVASDPVFTPYITVDGFEYTIYIFFIQGFYLRPL
jgi:hypothetical protein